MAGIAHTAARIHVGLVEMSASLGRVDLGVGIALREPRWHVAARPAADISVDWRANATDRSAEVLAVVRRLTDRLHVGGFAVKVAGGIPEHVGLGSTTALYMALGSAAAAAVGAEFPPFELASIVGRGGTSGVGVHHLSASGLILDAGHRWGRDKRDFGPSESNDAVRPPALICSLPFPAERVLYVIPRLTGVSGARERDLFRQHCPIPDSEVSRAARIVLALILPGAAEADLAIIADGVDRLQDVGFKQREIDSYGTTLRGLLADLRKAGGVGIGMSSFGPGLYVLSGDWDRIRACCGARGAAVSSVTELSVDNGPVGAMARDCSEC